MAGSPGAVFEYSSFSRLVTVAASVVFPKGPKEMPYRQPKPITKKAVGGMYIFSPEPGMPETAISSLCVGGRA